MNDVPGRQGKEEDEVGCWCHGFLGMVESPVMPIVKACVLLSTKLCRIVHIEDICLNVSLSETRECSGQKLTFETLPFLPVSWDL